MAEVLDGYREFLTAYRAQHEADLPRRKGYCADPYMHKGVDASSASKGQLARMLRELIAARDGGWSLTSMEELPGEPRPFFRVVFWRPKTSEERMMEREVLLG